MVTVLLADDSAYMRNLLKSILSGSEYEVVAEASNGDEAIDQYKKFLPDVVLMDIVMDTGRFAKSGLEALEKILSSDPQAKVVICSGLDQQALINKSMKAGAKAFVTKPIEPEKLFETLTMCTDLRILSEMGNMGAGRAATVLSKLAKQPIQIELPKLETGPPHLVTRLYGAPDRTVTAVHMRLQTEPDCDALLVFEPTEALKIAGIMTENLKDSTPEMEDSAVKEMGSNMICAFFSAIADFSDLTFVPSEPYVITDSFEAIIDVFLAKQAMTAKSALVFQALFKREHSSANGFFLIIPSPEFQKQLIEAGKKWLSPDDIQLPPQSLKPEFFPEQSQEYSNGEAGPSTPKYE